jgi:hypothetical protein
LSGRTSRAAVGGGAAEENREDGEDLLLSLDSSSSSNKGDSGRFRLCVSVAATVDTALEDGRGSAGGGGVVRRGRLLANCGIEAEKATAVDEDAG